MPLTITCHRCGKTFLARPSDNAKYCSQHCANTADDKTGDRYGSLVVLGPARVPDKHSTFRWRCKCDCGSISFRKTTTLHAKSLCCVCHTRNAITHGMSGSREYHSWFGLVQRCTNARNAGYKDYGGRGIDVDPRWVESFSAFLSDMGKMPSEQHSIDRVNNEGGYWKSNCRWATRLEQSLNTRRTRWIEYNEVVLPLYIWAKRQHLKLQVIHWRLGYGWSIERALFTPVRHTNA